MTNFFNLFFVNSDKLSRYDLLKSFVLYKLREANNVD